MNVCCAADIRGQPPVLQRDAAVRSRSHSAARNVVATLATQPQRHSNAVATFQPWLSAACPPTSTRRLVHTHAKKQDPLILRSVDEDPAIDALIFEEVGYVSRHRCL